MINVVGQDRVRYTNELGYTPVKAADMREYISHNRIG